MTSQQQPTTNRWLMLAALVLLGACPKAPPPKKALPPPPPPDPAAEVRELVKFVYTTLETGDPDPLKPIVAANVMAYGLAPSDTYAARDPLINFLRQELLSIGLETEVLRIRSGRVDVGVADSGQSAWFWDLPRVEYEKKGKGKPTTWLARVTGHAIKSDGQWVIDAVHVSLGVPDEKIYAADAARKYLPPADVLAERGKDSDELVGLARRILDEVVVKVDRTSDRTEVVLLGTGPGELFEGGKAFKDLVRPKLAEIKKAVFSYKVDGPVRSRLAPGAGTGWVAANVVLRLGAGKKQQVLPAFRVLWVFAEEKGLWNLVSEHQSLALKQEMRAPADEDAIKAYEAVDSTRRQRNDKKPVRDAVVADAGTPPSSGKGGNVTAATDGGVGTFD